MKKTTRTLAVTLLALMVSFASALPAFALDLEKTNAIYNKPGFGGYYFVHRLASTPEVVYQIDNIFFLAEEANVKGMIYGRTNADSLSDTLVSVSENWMVFQKADGTLVAKGTTEQFDKENKRFFYYTVPYENLSKEEKASQVKVVETSLEFPITLD